MIERLRANLAKARARMAELDRHFETEQSFAHALESRSLASHIDDLVQQIALLDAKPTIEVVEWRLKADLFADGAVPLNVIARIADDVRQMLGYAALRLRRGGDGRVRVPSALYDELDLRLAAVLPGSSRLVITAAAGRDLLDDGLAKGALSRVFHVLESEGQGEAFREAITDLGPSGARRLRDFLHLVVDASSQLDVTWSYSGEQVQKWAGTSDSLRSVVNALDRTELNTRDTIVLEGVVELLSKRERLQLRGAEGRTFRVLFPRRLLPMVSLLHLDQSVRLRCSVTEASNPFTGEASAHYELLHVLADDE